MKKAVQRNLIGNDVCRAKPKMLVAEIRQKKRTPPGPAESAWEFGAMDDV
jgi:hypothetical protein